MVIETQREVIPVFSDTYDWVKVGWWLRKQDSIKLEVINEIKTLSVFTCVKRAHEGAYKRAHERAHQTVVNLKCYHLRKNKI